MPDEIQLIKSVLSGDRNAFRQVIEQYQALVVHIVIKMGISPVERDDIYQDVFLKVYQNLDSFNKKSKLSTWIARIAINTSINYLKQKKADSLDAVKDDSEPLSESIASNDLTPDFQTENSQTSAIIWGEVEKMPVKYKTVILMYHLAEMSYEEIADAVRLPQGTVKSYLFRGRKYLKDKLETVYNRADL